MTIVARIIAGLFAALFVWAGIIQFNDPDPFLWVLIYGAAAACLLLVALNKPPPFPVMGGLAVVAAVWSIWLAVIVFGSGEVKQMFPDEEQTGWVIVDAEEGREMGGLAIVAGVVGGFAVWTRRRTSAHS